MIEYKYCVSEEDSDERLDIYIAKYSEYTRSFIQQLIKQHKVKVDMQDVKCNYRLKEGQVIYLQVDEIKPLNLEPETMPLDIIYEDDDLLVINKQKGLVVHPGAGNHQHTLVNALLAYSDSLSDINGYFRPGIVHRLDKDTSGLLVCAKNNKTHLFLSEQLKDKRCYRKYYALVSGVLPNDEGEIIAPIGRDYHNRQKMAVVADGKEARTLFKVIKRYNDMTLVSCELKTGRTHQIRVHLAYIGYPILNDSKYSNHQLLNTNGQFLHAYYLSFVHPKNGKRLAFECSLPDYFMDYLTKKENRNE